MFSRGEFDPVAYSYMGAIGSAVSGPRSPLDEWHYPFWIVPTVDLISFITMQACRFILPADQLFYQARLLDQTQKIENGQRVVYTRKGLGLSQAIERMGRLWFEARHFYWPGGHIAIAELLYIPRSPLQARWSHQASIQAGSARSISPAYFITLWIDEAKEASHAGNISLVARLYERAITLAAEEVGRSYSQHLLAKLQFFWARLRRL
ncbi:hypothetical protein GGI35DRAFT_484975 [Trichoderma velutinum]